MKGKKLLASTLSAAMVLSTMAVPVFAADGVAEVSGTTYSTFADAVAAAKAEDGVQTIKLLADTSIAKTDFYDSVDLNGKTLTFTASDSWLYANVTISNGDIVANDLPANAQGVFSATYGTLSFDGVNFECKNLPGGAYVIDAQQGTFTAKDSSFTIENFGGVAVFGGGGPNFVFDNTSINITGAEVGILHNAELKNGAVYNATRVHAPFQTGTDKEIKISGSTFTATDCENIAMMKYAGSSLTVDEASSVSVNNGAKVFASPECTVNAADLPVTTAPVTIGIKGYATLAEAFAAATSEDTITLYEDVTPDLSSSTYYYDLTRAKVLDLNNHTLTLNDGNLWVNNIEFKNGTIKIDLSEPASQAIFWISQENANVTFTNVIIDADKLKATYFVECWAKGSNVVFNDCEISAVSTNGSAVMSALLCSNNVNTKIIINNTDINVENVDGHVAFNSDVVVKGDSKITANNVATALCAFDGTKTISIEDDATVEASNLNTAGHDWNPENAGIVLGAATGYEVANPANVKTSVYRVPAEDNLASAVRVSFADVTATDAEGEKVYDIYVEADSDETINRLTSAQLAIDVTPVNGDFESTVSGTEKINVGKNGAMYHFNLDGITAADITGAKIKLGSVTVRGFGQFKLGITADDETIKNQIHAAAMNDNIVTDYIVDGADEATTGELVLPETTEVIIAEATRKLTINVTFPNAINDNVADYQDMKVTVTGGKDGATQEIALGGEMTDGAYTVVFPELVKDGIYNVTVSGAGYRTARYTVTMNADKTLNFWNNVKDNATEVETGNETIKKNVTFLAGELVNDGKINIYDLSAVVSYFGATNLVEDHPEYAKYDLNRDGKIDSKDIAYVLVSWGK